MNNDISKITNEFTFKVLDTAINDRHNFVSIRDMILKYLEQVKESEIFPLQNSFSHVLRDLVTDGYIISSDYAGLNVNSYSIVGPGNRGNITVKVKDIDKCKGYRDELKGKNETDKLPAIEKIITPQVNEIVPTKEIKPIWWQKSARLLGHLLDELAKNNLIERDCNINEIIKAHFIDKDKKPFKDSIKQNRSGASNINKKNKPKKAEIIDKIIKNLPKK